MEYKEFKTSLDAALDGDRNIPSDKSKLDSLVFQSLKEVAKEAEPLLLFSKDETKKLKNLTDELYIRVPIKPLEDTDNIDIDETLVYAVINKVAEKIAHHKTKDYYDNKAQEFIDDYTFERYESVYRQYETVEEFYNLVMLKNGVIL